jgi:2-polyprenyl-3-methyl-5-hydroxy-6-metoxy-1,4-benzoquinol methylase
MNKYYYLFNSVLKRIKGFASRCPNCGEPESQCISVDTKFVVTRLMECSSCHLLFRTPQETAEESRSFYQESYSQGYTTDVPSEEELKELLSSGFSHTERDYSRYIELFDALGVSRSARVLDFGCSWGYGLHQFKKAGYEAKGYEVSLPRCHYAKEKLDVEAFDHFDALGDGFDVFFSSHVLEHVDSVGEVWKLASRILKKGGLFIAYTPNGSKAYRESNYPAFHKSWGLKHPNLLQDEFVKNLAQQGACYVSTYPHDLQQVKSWNKSDYRIVDTSGWELLLIVVK